MHGSAGLVVARELSYPASTQAPALYLRSSQNSVQSNCKDPYVCKRKGRYSRQVVGTAVIYER